MPSLVTTTDGADAVGLDPAISNCSVAMIKEEPLSLQVAFLQHQLDPPQPRPFLPMHRINSSAKVEASDKSPTTPIAQSPRTNAHYANFRQSPRPRQTYPSLNKVADATQDSTSSSNNAGDASNTTSLDPPAKPPSDSNEKGLDDTTIVSAEKPSLSNRMKAGSLRFLDHTKNALFSSWVNVLLVFVPVGIAVNFAPIPVDTKPTIVFSMNAIAIIPLAGLLSHATESVASRMGDTMASLLNVTFGNAVELIIFIIALYKDEIRIVQASILGSILANLLLILGMAFLLGGLRFQEQIYNSTVTQMSACLLSLSVTSLLLPTAFHASFANYHMADHITVKISRGVSIVLLLVYVLYLLFQLKSHAYLYESTPQHVIDEESQPGVLADVMNHSESSESSDSETSSSSSENGAKRRIKQTFRHRRHRKSNASTALATSAPSGVSSPSPELKSAGESGTEGYFDPPERPPQEPQLMDQPGSSRPVTGDGNDISVPLGGDLEAQQGSSSKSAPAVTETKTSRFAKKRRKHKTQRPQKTSETAEMQDATAQQIFVAPRVEFVEEPEDVEPPTPPTKRPRAIHQFSRPGLVPSLPSLLPHTVFSNPPQRPIDYSLPNATSSTRADPLNLRRTSSLPGRFSGHQKRLPNHPGTQPAQPNNRAGPIAGENADEAIVPHMSTTAAVVLLLISTALVAFCAELLVDVIPHMISNTSVSQAFIGLIVLPIVGNAAEHVTAVSVAIKNKMDLAIGVSVGSSIQIALFITPVVVIIGWIMDKEMSLYFNLFETVSLFVTAFVVNFLVLDGRSNYLEGSLLIAAYIIIAVAAFFYPNAEQESKVGGTAGY